jgi:hypothetical protein
MVAPVAIVVALRKSRREGDEAVGFVSEGGFVERG